MLRFSRNFSLVILIFITSPQSFAESNLERGSFWLLGGELFLQDKTDTESPEVDNSGFGLGVKGVYSKYWKSWIADVGLGYRLDTMDDKDPEVETKAFWGELGVRYKLNQSWSIGPEFHLLSGADVSFSDVGTNSDDEPLSSFIGLRVMHNQYIGNKGHILRLGGQALTDLDIDNRQVTYYQFVVEFGWPCNCGEEKKPVPVAKKRIKKKRKPRPALKLDLRNAGVRFDSGKATLKGKSLLVIDRLSKVLKKYDRQWDEVRIEGHTDITGNYDKNVALSRARASTVEQEIVKRGVSATKLGSTGYGPDQPLDPARTKAAYAKNRRVELHLIGDRASPAFVRDLKRALGQ